LKYAFALYVDRIVVIDGLRGVVDGYDRIAIAREAQYRICGRTAAQGVLIDGCDGGAVMGVEIIYGAGE